MTFALTVISRAEWVLIFATLLGITAHPLLTIALYVKNRELKKQLAKMTKERDNLIA